ncbi:hypothetical protein [Pimelobacter simplex]|uniref:hypothetical protein n=1 Tax=Nocardioides simplex TaxID=2045 RepID=UPI00214FB4BF|nr:hypothetical protein [Pimelobacter simplex]UUW88691.1 hypothetical protein M0M43_23545 [Pimelobacter simplex]UUW90991.1 hypothetical protein M0M43_05775 [Pimelobacter simplex]UUW94820.1 hypothetical protein M0M48_24280 [Pimelobacter simplex]UUW98196.1 hypothetical protein M0M48_12195 [Pimelobacter simplex]
MTPRLPVSIDPHLDESIASMLRRLSTTTGIPVHTLYPYGVNDRITERQMGALACTLGLQTRRLRTHTLHHRLAGRHGRKPTSIELRRSDRTICSVCGIGSLWSGLVWVSHCPTCHSPLNAGLTADRAVHALEMQDALLRGMQTPAVGFADRRLRLLRLLRLHVHLATGPAAICAATGARPAGSWQNPAWIAGFAEHAWPASRTVQATRDLIGERTLTHLGETPAPEDDCPAARQALHDQLRSSRITEAAIPDYLHPRHRALDVDTAGEDLGHGIARALRREAIHAATGTRPTLAQLDDRYGDLRKQPMTATYVHHLGNTSAGLRILARETDRLAHADICDYRHRRTVLTTLHSVPTSTLAPTAVPRTPRNQRLAAAWIWLELTQGTLSLSPHHAGMRRDLRSFDQALLGEDRLTLIEYGHQHLGAVADDVARDAQQTLTRAARHADAG